MWVLRIRSPSHPGSARATADNLSESFELLLLYMQVKEERKRGKLSFSYFLSLTGAFLVFAENYYAVPIPILARRINHDLLDLDAVITTWPAWIGVSAARCKSCENRSFAQLGNLKSSDKSGIRGHRITDKRRPVHVGTFQDCNSPFRVVFMPGPFIELNSKCHVCQKIHPSYLPS